MAALRTPCLGACGVGGEWKQTIGRENATSSTAVQGPVASLVDLDRCKDPLQNPIVDSLLAV